jgi:hypothetical protein
MSRGKRQRRYAGVEEVGQDVYVLNGAHMAVEFVGGQAKDVNYGPRTAGGSSASKTTPVPWGANNDQPDKILQLVHTNHLKPQLLKTERDFLLGSRLGTYVRGITAEGQYKITPVIREDIEAWMELVDLDDCLLSAAYNLVYSGNYFIQISLGAGSEPAVAGVESLDFPFMRAAYVASGKIQDYLYCPDWKAAKPDSIKVLPAFDKKEPTKFAQFCFHGRDRVPGQVFYDVPAWWGSTQWTAVSNLIPLYHESGLLNGYNIKYHIRIPQSYFNQFTTPEAKQAAKAELLSRLNAMLAGVKNADKAFISEFATDPQTQKPLPGWEIVPIENKMSYEAYDKVNSAANIAHTSSHGIDPSLAGIDTGGKLGGSGSEKRLSHQLHIALRTPTARRILLKFLNDVVRPLMGWTDIVFGFEDVQLTTLDENPTGKQAAGNTAL